MSSGTAASPLLAVGGRGREIGADELVRHLDGIADGLVGEGVRRVLIVPPDHTRLHSRGGAIAAHLDRALRSAGVDVDLMSALGTHRPLGAEECRLLFGDDVAVERLLEHRWRDGVTAIGEIAADEVDAIAGRPLGLSLPVAVNSALVGGGYDVVVAAGQVVPHEVAGFGGYTKHLCIGLGGRDIIQRTHFVGAVHGIEETLGRVDTPVRTLIDLAFDRFVAPRCRTLFVLTVVEAAGSGGVLRGLYAGEGGTGESGGAAFAAAPTSSRSGSATSRPTRCGRGSARSRTRPARESTPAGGRSSRSRTPASGSGARGFRPSTRRGASRRRSRRAGCPLPCARRRRRPAACA